MGSTVIADSIAENDTYLLRYRRKISRISLQDEPTGVEKTPPSPTFSPVVLSIRDVHIIVGTFCLSPSSNE